MNASKESKLNLNSFSLVFGRTDTGQVTYPAVKTRKIGSFNFQRVASVVIRVWDNFSSTVDHVSRWSTLGIQ